MIFQREFSALSRVTIRLLSPYTSMYTNALLTILCTWQSTQPDPHVLCKGPLVTVIPHSSDVPSPAWASLFGSHLQCAPSAVPDFCEQKCLIFPIQIQAFAGQEAHRHCTLWGALRGAGPHAFQPEWVGPQGGPTMASPTPSQLPPPLSVSHLFYFASRGQLSLAPTSSTVCLSTLKKEENQGANPKRNSPNSLFPQFFLVAYPAFPSSLLSWRKYVPASFRPRLIHLFWTVLSFQG